MNNAPITATEILRNRAELSGKSPPSALEAHYLKPIMDRLMALIQAYNRGPK